MKRIVLLGYGEMGTYGFEVVGIVTPQLGENRDRTIKSTSATLY